MNRSDRPVRRRRARCPLTRYRGVGFISVIGPMYTHRTEGGLPMTFVLAGPARA